MSRSYKKSPFVKDNVRGAKWAKAHANRLFRRCRREMQSGKSAVHRKYSESWNIHDFRFRWSRRKAEAEWETEERCIRRGTGCRSYDTMWHADYGTKARFMSHWFKWTLRK